VIRVRSATPGDYGRFVAWFAELEVDDPTPTAAQWEAMSRTALVAERDGQPAGYLTHQLLADVGYVRNVVSDPTVRRSGVGRALLVAAREEMQAAGLRRWCLNVKPGNVAARALYESLGMRAQYASCALRFDWSLVDGLQADLAVAQLLGEADDKLFETAFGLPQGLLAEHRRQGRVEMGLRDNDGRVAGVSSFSPSYPGAFPFRVARPSLAGTLLRALRPYALPEQGHMQVVTEDDDALEAMLLNAGAELRMRILHYEGALDVPRP
jgi:GNAT superfamily N-acetyltransferase